MKSGSKIVLLALLVPAMALAIGVIGPPPCVGDGCDYHYVLTLPDVDYNGTSWVVDTTPGDTWSFSFDWAGPLRYNSPAGSDLGYTSPSGPPIPDWTFTGLTFSADAYSHSTVLITFKDEISADTYLNYTVNFLLDGTDTFWATLGPQTFASTSPANDPSSGSFVSDASFTVNAPLLAFEPDCSGYCSVDTSTSRLAATPEPTSILLLGTIALSLGFVAFKRRVRGSTPL
jgi:hypothetical protein